MANIFVFSSVLESSAPVDDEDTAAAALVADEPVRGSDDDNNSSGEKLLGELVDDDNEGGVAASATTVTGATAAANVDSECESDDEWNYVKPTTTTAGGEEQEPENLVAEADQQREIQEQHAEAQAIAESQEHCVEVSGHSGINLLPSDKHLEMTWNELN